MMAILEKVDKPADLKMIKKELLPKLAEEIRTKIIDTVSHTGGHLASSLGAVELTIALHYIFHAPQDKIVWDVGHQTYAHKLLTGRRNKFQTLRQYGGLSGFPKPDESENDTFVVGHASTSISAALGMAVARDLRQENYKVIAVVGDGSMTGGLAFEALNNAGHLHRDLIVILNDNEMFISRKIGAFAGYLTKIITGGLYKKLTRKAERFLTRMSVMGVRLTTIAKRVKVLLFPGMFFEEMGFAYLGPFEGHDLNRLTEIFETVKGMTGPVCIHVVTKKGKGYKPAEKEPTRFHGIGEFNIITGESEAKDEAISYTEIFGKTMVRLARENDKIVGVTAAMSDGTGLNYFAAEFPGRFFDVGIAEGHAVVFAGGLAASGLKPVVSIYSTFMQRAYDQVIHDIALQNLPVVFILDRAGLVGEDGPTHHGVFDLSFMRTAPNMVVMSPKDENELQHMMHTAIAHKGPVALRYPRGPGLGIKLDKEFKKIAIGKAEVLVEGDDVAILAIGAMVYPALEAAKLLLKDKIKATVVNACFVKPLDGDLIRLLAKKVKCLVTVEENVITGGFGSAVTELLSREGLRLKNIGLPDKFIEHGSMKILREKYGLTGAGIYRITKEFVNNK
ncbi:MAG: 1-deoxy-D-xylulose-5-phosphate synthase [Elusimicrobia bacterium]|nr:1-deoxy-D-xylulose-5-phosphate synthase [Elusimicrobiota bacterium]